MYPIDVFSKTVLAAIDASDDALSAIQDVREIRTLFVQASWSGTSTVGAINILASTDGIEFVQVSTVAVNGNTGIVFIKEPNVGYYYAQIQYVSTSGDGTLTAKISGKF